MTGIDTKKNTSLCQRGNLSIILYFGVPFNIPLLLAPQRIIILLCWPEVITIWHKIFLSHEGIPSINPKYLDLFQSPVLSNISLLSYLDKLYRTAVRHQCAAKQRCHQHKNIPFIRGKKRGTFKTLFFPLKMQY